MQQKNCLFILSLMVLACWQCTSDKSTPDISDIQVDIDIRRFEQDLFALNPEEDGEIPFEAQFEALRAEYPDFCVVFEKMIRNPYALDDNFAEDVRQFISHEGVRSLYDTTQVIYQQIEDVEADLEEAFRYYRYYLPERPVPEVVSYISEFGVGAFTYSDSLLGIGWDFFLGQDFPYDYKTFPDYIQRSMDREHLVAKAIEAVAVSLVDASEPSGKQLLEYMIDNGKTLYIKSLLLPNASEAVLLEWTPAQVAWMNETDNERELWTQIIKRDLLYSARLSDIQKMIGASPAGATWMPPESPGKAANWIGWKIVEAYVQRHPELTTEQLLEETDVQKILNQSKYRPKR